MESWCTRFKQNPQIWNTIQFWKYGQPVPEVKERCRDSFAIETTLSSTMYARRIRLWKTCGYDTSLHFIELPAEEFALQRVDMRVAAGGHTVSELDVKRRYHRGLILFQHTYKPIVDEWYHWFSNNKGLCRSLFRGISFATGILYDRAVVVVFLNSKRK